jgi:RND family efflux transporter MFP subunit
MKRAPVENRCKGYLVLLAFVLAGCDSGGAKTDTPPPAAEKLKTESDLARITLSAKSVESLNIRSELLRTRNVQDTLTLTGWIMAKQGNEVTVTAPVAGYVRSPAQNGGVPVAGLIATNHQELLTLEPVLTQVEQFQLSSLKRGIEGEITKARANLTAAEKELDRVQDLVRKQVKTEQELEQVQARFKNAKEDLATAEDKRKMFAKTDDDKSGARLNPVPIRAPRSGTVLTVHVSPGQYVAAAAPLVTIADLSEVWVRVPIPEHYLPRIDAKKPASITRTETAPFVAEPVALIPLVDANRRTADMIYALKSSSWQGPFAKDQMMSMLVPVGKEIKETVVPYSAIIFDSYGSAWIYLEVEVESDGDHVYARQRVELGPRVGDEVAIRGSAKSGDRVVASGAALLFSREFHSLPADPNRPKSPVDDDD